MLMGIFEAINFHKIEKISRNEFTLGSGVNITMINSNGITVDKYICMLDIIRIRSFLKMGQLL